MSWEITISYTVADNYGCSNTAFCHVKVILPYGAEEISDEREEVEAEYYDLRKLHVSSESLAPGIYIVRQGNTVKKTL